MYSESEYERLHENHEALRLQFISTELDLAITFCQMALSTGDPDKAERHTANARHAYKAALKQLQQPGIGRHYRRGIDEKLQRLEQLFAKLDGVVR